jgi:hypothetical protein
MLPATLGRACWMSGTTMICKAIFEVLKSETGENGRIFFFLFHHLVQLLLYRFERAKFGYPRIDMPKCMAHATFFWPFPSLYMLEAVS